MCTIHIGIGHNNNLVIAKFRNIKVISIAFGETTSERVNHRLNLSIGKNFINTCLFNVQNLTANREDCLIHTVTGRLRRTTRRISLYDEDFTFARITALAVRKLAITIKRIFLFCQKIGLRLLLCLTNLCRFLSTAQNFLKRVKVTVKEMDNLIVGHLASCLRSIRIIEFRLSLSLKSWIRMLDRHNRSHTVTDICTSKVCILLLQDAKFSRILIHDCRKCSLESSQVCTPFRVVNIVTEAEYIFMELIYILNNSLHFNAFRLPFKVNRFMNDFVLLIQITNES